MSRGVSALVLDNYQRITLARKHLWTWAQITAALHDEHPGLPTFTESAVQSAFKRIERGIKAKRIKPVGKQQIAADPGSIKKTVPERKIEQPKQTGQFHRVGETAKEDDGLTEAERIINSLPHI